MSNNLDLSQVAAAQNQKEVTINDQAGELDAALTEQFVADVSSGNVALTAGEYRRAIHIKATGAATSDRTVTLQAIKKLSVISNFSTTDSVDFVLGSATITLDPADVANPTMALVYTDGTADGLYVVSSGVGGGGSGASLYDFGFAYPGGPPTSDEVLSKVMIPRDITLPADMAGAAGHVDVNPDAQLDIDVTVDNGSIGTISISDGGVFSFVTDGNDPQAISAGSVVRFVAPNTPVGDLENIAVTLQATVG